MTQTWPRLTFYTSDPQFQANPTFHRRKPRNPPQGSLLFHTYHVTIHSPPSQERDLKNKILKLHRIVSPLWLKYVNSLNIATKFQVFLSPLEDNITACLTSAASFPTFPFSNKTLQPALCVSSFLGPERQGSGACTPCISDAGPWVLHSYLHEPTVRARAFPTTLTETALSTRHVPILQGHYWCLKGWHLCFPFSCVYSMSGFANGSILYANEFLQD